MFIHRIMTIYFIVLFISNNLFLIQTDNAFLGTIDKYFPSIACFSSACRIEGVTSNFMSGHFPNKTNKQTTFIDKHTSYNIRNNEHEIYIKHV